MAADDDDEEGAMAYLGTFPAEVKLVEDASEETMLLWAFRQPGNLKPNAFVSQGSLQLDLDACGQLLHIVQAPSSMNTSGVTGGVMWDSGVVLAKLLEHAVDTLGMQLQGKKCIELGSGCGLTGDSAVLDALDDGHAVGTGRCVAALLGANVILTDMNDRLRLLKKNVDENVCGLSKSGSAQVLELNWGDKLDAEFIDPLPDFVVASDVIYNEEAMPQLLHTLRELTGPTTTVLISGELRNDAVMETFFKIALDDFAVGRLQESDLHPDYCSPRVAVYVLVRKPGTRLSEDNPWTTKASM